MCLLLPTGGGSAYSGVTVEGVVSVQESLCLRESLSLSMASLSRGLCPWWCLDEEPPSPVGTAAVGTHPTGMHSYLSRFLLKTA